MNRKEIERLREEAEKVIESHPSDLATWVFLHNLCIALLDEEKTEVKE